jgi:hypothetical protein
MHLHRTEEELEQICMNAPSLNLEDIGFAVEGKTRRD